MFVSIQWKTKDNKLSEKSPRLNRKTVERRKIDTSNTAGFLQAQVAGFD